MQLCKATISHSMNIISYFFQANRHLGVYRHTACMEKAYLPRANKEWTLRIKFHETLPMIRGVVCLTSGSDLGTEGVAIFMNSILHSLWMGGCLWMGLLL